MISDGILSDVTGATEEVMAICIIQMLHSASTLRKSAYLVKTEGISWEVDFEGDEERLLRHNNKMSTKESVCI